MAQYYQLVSQGDSQPIQAVTIEELRHIYPNLTCVETGNGVQYVINQEDNSQFQQQQVNMQKSQIFVFGIFKQKN